MSTASPERGAMVEHLTGRLSALAATWNGIVKDAGAWSRDHPGEPAITIGIEAQPGGEGDDAVRVYLDSEEKVKTTREVTPRRVLEAISEGEDDDLSAQLPSHIREEVVGKVMDIEAAAEAVWDRHKDLMKTGRRDFALAIKDEPSTVKALVFALADEKTHEQVRAIAIRAVEKTYFDAIEEGTTVLDVPIEGDPS